MSEEIENGEASAKPRRDNVALLEPSVKKISIWLDQIKAKKKGLKISKKEIVNWLIEKMPDTLSNSDLNAIIDKFYDEEIFLRQLLRDVQKAKLDGQTEPSIEFVVKTKKIERLKDDSVNSTDEVKV